MRIAHVLTSLELGGGERIALELASGQTAAGHRVVMVNLSPTPDGALGDELRERGVPVRHVPKRPGFDVTLFVRLAALFRRERVDVVHLHNRLPLIYGAAAGRLAGATVVHTRHGPRPGTPRQKWLERGAAQLIHAYVAVSRDVRDNVQRLNDCPPEKLAVIENGIDVVRYGGATDERSAAREALGLPADAWVVGSVGRFAPEKDYPFLVRAVAPLLGPADRLVIVGEGETMGAVRAEVSARGVEPFVLLPGRRGDVPRLLAAFDIFVLSSRMEGMPLVVLEAMAAGVPVVATAVGGLPGLITEGETGFLVPSGDEAALRARLVALRAEPTRARAAATLARAHVRERHSRETMVRRYLELYAEADPA
jgi:glycosyltransferase involved in cell wall biosynthesis